MYYLTVCAIVRNEILYLREWLEFHRIQGVEHFFIYDNESDDGTEEFLKSYVEKGLVTYEKFPGSPCQLQAYQKCLMEHGPKTEWMAFIDLDEFLYCYDGAPLDMFLTAYLDFGKNQEKLAGLAVRWYLYGSNGKEAWEDRLVTERFLRRDSKVNRHCKSIVRPEYIERVGRNAHVFYPFPGKEIRDENRTLMPKEYATLDNGTANRIRINHYHVKSWQEFLIKRSKPRPSLGTLRPKEKEVEFFVAHNKNDVFDASAAQYVNEILENVNNTNNTNG